MSRKLVLLGPYPPPYGGVSVYIKTLFEELKNKNVELWTYGDERVAAPNVFYMRDKRWELLPLLIRRGSKARIADCSHFLVEYPSILVPVWVALKSLRRFEWIKIIQDGSLPSRYVEFNPIRKELFRLAVESVTEFIVISQELKDWLQTEILVTQKVTLIKNLFPLRYSPAETALPKEIETSLAPYLQRSKRVCSIGVFISSYGFRHVAEAVETIRNETRTDIGLLLIDGDFAAEDSYRAEVLRGREWIIVLKNVAHPLVFEILSRSDVFVRAFGLDSYGLSRVEAIWSGVPVVATKAGETRGMLLYDFGNVEELVTQLKRALFGDQEGEMNYWAELYRKEAGTNLESLISKLKMPNI